MKTFNFECDISSCRLNLIHKDMQFCLFKEAKESILMRCDMHGSPLNHFRIGEHICHISFTH